jgi:hypothetical protein
MSDARFSRAGNQRQRVVADLLSPEDGGDAFLRNVG